VLECLRVLAHDDDPSVRVSGVDLLHQVMQEAHGDRLNLFSIRLLAAEALKVCGPLLVIIEPG